MLGWTAGTKPEDGAWGAHWYDAVYNSTGFGLAPGKPPELAPDMQDILDEALAIYEHLRAFALCPKTD